MHFLMLKEHTWVDILEKIFLRHKMIMTAIYFTSARCTSSRWDTKCEERWVLKLVDQGGFAYTWRPYKNQRFHLSLKLRSKFYWGSLRYHLPIFLFFLLCDATSMASSLTQAITWHKLIGGISSAWIMSKLCVGWVKFWAWISSNLRESLIFSKGDALCILQSI